MRKQFLGPLVCAAFFTTVALAKDRPVTDAERTMLAAAVAEQGCSGGKMEFDMDDKEFEVDDVRCSDGRKYDLKFDATFKLIKKAIDD